MTICTDLGYRVGDHFEKVGDDDVFKKGSIVELTFDDGTELPRFKLVKGELEDWLQHCKEAYDSIEAMRKIHQLRGQKPDFDHIDDSEKLALDANVLRLDISGLLADEFFKVPSMVGALEAAKTAEDIFKASSKVAGTTGVKADDGKLRHSLLPQGALDEVLKALEFGAKKYAVDNWQRVEDAETRYYDAAHRHLAAYWNGESTDPESGKHHLAHAICCAMFLMWFDQNKGISSQG